MHPLLRTLVMALGVYVGMTVVLRIAGKRTLSKLHVFDFVIIVALGSTIASVVLLREITIGAGVIALAVPIALQWIVTFIATRSRKFEHVVTATAVMLVENGEYLHEMMRHETITEDEVNHAIRREGLGSIRDVAAVVLETNGELTVVSCAKLGDGSMLKNMKRRP